MLAIQTKKALIKKLQSLPNNKHLGLVPTMGALHQGHASLIKKSVQENSHTVVSVFVNPTQFNNTEDLEKYPKTLDADVSLIKEINPEIIVFTPTAKEVYDTGIHAKIYDFNGLDKVMEGAFREGHFNGVGTIVEALLTLIKPNKAYFGEKDFQQLRIIQKLTEIQKIPIEIVGCPIVREAHGLAMSSRNERLDPILRQKAGFIYETLHTAKQKFGTENAANIKELVTVKFAKHPDFKLEYFEITDVTTLTPIKEKINNTKYRAFIAVFADGIRLIDNVALN